MITPGTRIESHDLASWLEGLGALLRRRISAKRYKDISEHWIALPLEWVRDSADRQALIEFPAYMRQAHLVPMRGDRFGTKWELAHMYRNNTLMRLERPDYRRAPK